MMYKYIGFLRTDARGITLRPHQVLTGDARMWSLANPVRVSNHSLTIKQLMDTVVTLLCWKRITSTKAIRANLQHGQIIGLAS